MKRKTGRRPATADATTTRPPPSLSSFFGSGVASASSNSVASSSSSTSSGQTLTPPVITQISRGVRTMLVNSFPYNPKTVGSPPRRLFREQSLSRPQKLAEHTVTTSAMSFSTSSTSTYAASDIHCPDFTIKRGKRHHAYPPKEAPYPTSYESAVLDHDVIDAEWSKDMAQSVTYHVFETPPKKVLDLGCGTGAWVLEAARVWKDSKFVGFDIAPIQADLGLLDPVRSSSETNVLHSHGSISSISTLAESQSIPPRSLHSSNPFGSPTVTNRGRSSFSGVPESVNDAADSKEIGGANDHTKPRSSSLAALTGDPSVEGNFVNSTSDVKSGIRQRRDNYPPTSFSMRENNMQKPERLSRFDLDFQQSKDVAYKSDDELASNSAQVLKVKRSKRPKTLSERIRWIHGNFLETLPFPDNYFDYIHIRKVARGIPETKWDAFFAEISRILKPGGAFEMFETDLSFPGGDFVPNPQIERRYWQDNHSRKEQCLDAYMPITPASEMFPRSLDGFARYGASNPGTAFARFLDEGLGLGQRYREMGSTSSPQSSHPSTPPIPTSSRTIGTNTSDSVTGSDAEGASSDASDPLSPSTVSTPALTMSPRSPRSPSLLKENPWQSTAGTGGRIRPPSTLLSSHNANYGFPPEKQGDGGDGLTLTKIRTEGLDSASTMSGRRSAVSPPSASDTHYQISSLAPVISMWGVYYPPAQKVHARYPKPLDKVSSHPQPTSPDTAMVHDPMNHPARDVSPPRHPDQLLRPYDPRDHTALQLIYEALHESRFINLRPLSLIYNYLVLHLDKVKTHPPVIMYAPERPKVSMPKGAGNCSEAADNTTMERGHGLRRHSNDSVIDQAGLGILLSKAMPSMSRFLEHDALQNPPDISIPPPELQPEDCLAIDMARSGPLPHSVLQQLEATNDAPVSGLPKSTDPPASQMQQIIHELNGLPNKSFKFDVRLLGMHLAQSVMGVLGCVEEMWEYVKSREPEADRTEFDELVQRYAADMRHRIGMTTSVERLLSWNLNKKDRSQIQKDFEAQLQRVLELEAEVERSGEGLDGPSRTPSASPVKESAKPKEAKMVSRSVRVFVGWKV